MPLFVFIVGAAIGSFLNVCIFRIPDGASIVFPASHCLSCKTRLKAYDNIPILSYLLLRGRCRECGTSISVQYPLVELGAGLAALVIFLFWGLSWSLLMNFTFVASLIVVTVIDLRHQIIPHLITLPGIPLFAVAAVLFLDVSPLDSFLGIMIGAGTLYFVAVYYEWITDREGMGGGDVNLLAMMGAFLGWQSLLHIILVASFSGAVIGIAAMLRQGKDTRYAVPFGPFLAIGAVSYLFLGNSILAVLAGR